ncbi:MAG: glycoside hydrolase family 3 N-terminal domain-containing protein [bacterium]|nr:glycoside hydrolase family 3 N-terminal domain-containing protein [bacterium]
MLSIPLATAAQDAPYLDPTQPIEARVDDLLARMSLEEKIGQMTLVEIGSINTDDLAPLGIGGVLSGGGGAPDENTPEAWAEMVDGLQARALEAPLQIPLIYGVDAVHGHNNVYGAVIYPHNIGLGASRNPELVQQISRATACNMIATGIYWNYAPVVAVPQDIRWGRTYEAYGSDTALVTEMALAAMNGLQGDSLDDPYTVLATPKHYVADGGAQWETSTTNNYRIDQGDAIIDEATLRAVHLPPYQAAIENGALVIMTSFSSWNGVKLHGNRYLVTDVLKGELGFEGFVVSDWQGIDQINSDFYTAVVTAINAGIDMNMVPYNYQRFIDAMLEAVVNGDVTQERIDDAVRRILRVKFLLGLFEQPFSDPALLETFDQPVFRELGRLAAAQSAVLLENDGDVLPLNPSTEQTIFIAGTAADDIGIQSGGWTIEWQGQIGNITPGTTIREAIEATAENAEIYYDRLGRFRAANDASGNPLRADVGIVVIGEIPYAEGVGDRVNLNLPEPDISLIQRVRERSERLIVILLSGRPLLIGDVLETSDAFMAAWLPGTEGQGIADVLFGLQPFTGTLPFAFPRSEAQVPLSALEADSDGPLFPFGYGITTGDWRDTPVPEVTCG